MNIGKEGWTMKEGVVNKKDINTIAEVVNPFNPLCEKGPFTLGLAIQRQNQPLSIANQP